MLRRYVNFQSASLPYEDSLAADPCGPAYAGPIVAKINQEQGQDEMIFTDMLLSLVQIILAKSGRLPVRQGRQAHKDEKVDLL